MNESCDRTVAELAAVDGVPPLDRMTIHVRDRADMEPRLDDAVLTLRAAARLVGDRGILVTRHTAYDFTVELHPDVGYGSTYEKQEWEGR